MPESITGISWLRNQVLRMFSEDAIIMLDDDISACVCMVSLRCRKLSPEEALAMITNTAFCARGAEARLFGWHQRSDPRLLQRNDPFGVHHWVGGAVGVVHDANGGVPKWDELLKCKCDIDATLEELMVNRLVWNEARFCFVQERDKNLGGNSLFRSADRIAAEKRYLKRKWKAHIRFESYQSQDKTAIDGHGRAFSRQMRGVELNLAKFGHPHIQAPSIDSPNLRTKMVTQTDGFPNSPSLTIARGIHERPPLSSSSRFWRTNIKTCNCAPFVATTSARYPLRCRRPSGGLM